MSRYDYEASKQVNAMDFPFYALIMAAMRQADTHNAELLHRVFPEVGQELRTRYHAPGGFIEGDPE